MTDTQENRMTTTTASGFILGATTGMIQFFLKIDIAFGERLLEAAVTAFISGVCGILGSYIFGQVIKRIKNKDNEKISQR